MTDDTFTSSVVLRSEVDANGSHERDYHAVTSDASLSSGSFSRRLQTSRAKQRVVVEGVDVGARRDERRRDVCVVPRSETETGVRVQ